MATPRILDDPDAVADRILEALGGHVVLGLPLGLGKSVRIADALFRRAAADPSISLEILTALTLERPTASSDMEKRFLEPFADRVFRGYHAPLYAQALRSGRLPANISVCEFFLLAGRWITEPAAQQAYVSANYTHAAAMLVDKGVNVIAQLVAEGRDAEEGRYSLSCNTDITLDILPLMQDRGRPLLLVGEVNRALPYFGKEAALPADAFDMVLDRPEDEPALFVLPKQPVADADHAIGIHAASLVRDGGTIQIGIGSLGDALVAALMMRHRAPALFAKTLARLCGGTVPPDRETGPFAQGLYAASEMFVDGLMDLYRAGILKRRAADGALLHSGFFLGSSAFYRSLRELPAEERALFRMRGISFVNELYGEEERKRDDRLHARFVNSAMMATVLGEAVSDALEDGTVVSGVGGQYNFVAQAFALKDALSVITLNATRMSGGRRRSRILSRYGHTTIPRHLRDVFVTEYGVARLRGLGDRDCVAAMAAIADAAFAQDLVDDARAAGKIEKGFRLPASVGRNTPEHIADALEPARAQGYCRMLPLGSEFTAVEERLLPALALLRERTSTRPGLLRTVLTALFASLDVSRHRRELERMGLARPKGLRERLTRRLLAWALDRTDRRSEPPGHPPERRQSATREYTASD